MLSYVPASERRGGQLLRERRFDLIHSQFAVPSAPAAQRLARRHGLPHVLTILGGDVYDPSKRTSPHRLPLVRGVVRRLLESADRVLAGSRDVAHSARKWYGVTRPVEVVSLAITEPPPARPDRAAAGIEEGRFAMATVGRLVARKGLTDLLHVLHEVDDPANLLLVMGDGPLREPLEKEAAELGVSDQVRFLGRVSEADKWLTLASSDLYVSTSMHEGFGLVFLEGMHAGLPVVCYDHGGQTDFLETDVTGSLVKLGDRAGFADAVRRFRRDEEHRRRCADHNRERVRDYYADRCAARYLEVFREVAAGVGAGAS